MHSALISALAGTLAYLAIALIVELAAPLYPVSWTSRLRGTLLTLVKAAATVAILPALKAIWTSIGVQPFELQYPLLSVAFTLIASDFLAYWNHRILHRFFWPIHATHHSIRELSALNGYAHFLEKPVQFVTIAIPLSLVAWPNAAFPIAVVVVSSFLEYWIHSPTSAQMTAFRSILVTPRFHRIHHSLELHHFDKNFGIVFSFWDRMFGTAYEPAMDEWPDTGIHECDEPHSLTQYVAFPLRFLPTLRGVIFFRSVRNRSAT